MYPELMEMVDELYKLDTIEWLLTGPQLNNTEIIIPIIQARSHVRERIIEIAQWFGLTPGFTIEIVAEYYNWQVVEEVAIELGGTIRKELLN